MSDKMKSFDLLGLVKFLTTVFVFIHFIVITFSNAWSLESTGMIISVIVLFLLSLVGLINEYRDVQMYNREAAIQYPFQEKMEILFIFTLAAFLTYLVQVVFNQSSTFAASVISLLMVYLIPQRFDIFEITVYTGTIAGMAGTQFISTWPLALAFGLLAGIFYLIFQPSYRATGGRAGLMSYMTTLVFMYLILNWRPEMSGQIDRSMIFLSFILTFVGAYVTYYLHMNDILSVVKSAMVITLLFDLIFPSSLGLYTTSGFVGTIIAMTTPSKTRNVPFLSLITLFSFLAFVPAYPLMAGTTGKLGLVTLTGYLAADGASILAERLNRKSNNNLFLSLTNFFL